MIDKKVLEGALEDIATIKVGTLEGFDGILAKVVIEDQVYPNLRVISRLSLDLNINNLVVVAFEDKNLSKGIIMGVLDPNTDIYTKAEVDDFLAAHDQRITALENR